MLHRTPVPAAVPLLDTTGSPPVNPNELAVTEVGVVESFPLLHENALVGWPIDDRYTYCPLGPFQNPGTLKVGPTVPGGSSCWTLSMSVRLASVVPQLRFGSAVNLPMFVVLTT